jgi:acetyl esterase/lipase
MNTGITFRAGNSGWMVMGLVTLLMLAPPVPAEEQNADDETVVRRRVVYGRSLDKSSGEATDLLMDVYSPKVRKSDRSPAMVMIHGNPGNRPYNEQYARLQDYPISEFVKLGYVCFVPAYRFYGLDNVKTAVRFIRANAEEFRIDPERIVANGGSLGGSHSVSLAVTDDEESPPDIEDAANNAGLSARVRTSISWAGGPHFPEAFDNKDSPILILQGTEDTSTKPQRALQIAELCTKNGVPHEIFFFEGVGHSPERNAIARDDGRTMQEIIVDFLERNNPSVPIDGAITFKESE